MQRLRNLGLSESRIREIRDSGSNPRTIDWPAPTGGTVIVKRIINGQRVVAGDELYRIVDLSNVWVIADVAEGDLADIKLGTWYLDYTHQEYSGNSMLAIASYNAGPGAVGDWVAKAGSQDPDVFVENIPYSETKGYVKSVFENYWNYLRLYNPDVAQKLAQVSKEQPAGITPDS